MESRGHRHETSAGAVVFHRSGSEPRYLLIHDAHGNWGFPKGHVEPGESLLETARRELQEETGVTNAMDHGPVGEVRWAFRDGPHQVEKTCHYFLFEVDEMAASPQKGEGISEVIWLPVAEARHCLTFDLARSVLLDAAERLEISSGEDR